MKKKLISLLIALTLVMTFVVAAIPASADPADENPFITGENPFGLTNTDLGVIHEKGFEAFACHYVHEKMPAGSAELVELDGYWENDYNHFNCIEYFSADDFETVLAQYFVISATDLRAAIGTSKDDCLRFPLVVKATGVFYDADKDAYGFYTDGGGYGDAYATDGRPAGYIATSDISYDYYFEGGYGDLDEFFESEKLYSMHIGYDGTEWRYYSYQAVDALPTEDPDFVKLPVENTATDDGAPTGDLIDTVDGDATPVAETNGGKGVATTEGGSAYIVETDDNQILEALGISKEEAINDKTVVSLVADGVKAEDVKAEDVALVKSVLGEKVVAVYFDIKLYLGEENKSMNIVEETKGKVKITITVPEDLRKDNREFAMVRIHDGKAEILKGTYDAKTGKFTFETDKFSTYALVYEDNVGNTDGPAVEVANYLPVAIAVIFFGVAYIATNEIEDKKQRVK